MCLLYWSKIYIFGKFGFYIFRVGYIITANLGLKLYLTCPLKIFKGATMRKKNKKKKLFCSITFISNLIRGLGDPRACSVYACLFRFAVSLLCHHNQGEKVLGTRSLAAQRRSFSDGPNIISSTSYILTWKIFDKTNLLNSAQIIVLRERSVIVLALQMVTWSCLAALT